MLSLRCLGDERMIYLQAREIRIDVDPPVIMQLDGDPCGRVPRVVSS